jgi:TonB family protein
MKYKQFLILGAVLLAVLAFARQTNSARRIQRTEAIAMGNLIEVVPPQYPEEANNQHTTGKVVLQILIDNKGNVKEASRLSGDPLLADRTVSAVKQWRFRPYILDSEPVEVETTATVEYTADPPFVIAPKPLHGPMKLRVSYAVIQPNLTLRVEPQYPQEAKTKRVKGDVLLQVTISRKGDVIGMNAVKGDSLLVDAAMEAVKQWKFTPYLLNGEPVEVETTVHVRFPK